MRALIMAAGVATLLAGCAKQDRDPNPIAGTWIAEIEAIGEHGHSGFAVLAAHHEGGTRANATLTRGSAGGIHPWHLHAGTCEEKGDILGDPGAYPILRPDASGDASATVLLPIVLSTDEAYSVHLHQSLDDDTLVGCGELVSRL